jgi:sec-independent protein translocase protein TatB
VFDIGFSELIVCAIVALLVIGPERMPEAVRTVGLWIGRFKRGLRETRSEIERQMGVDDIRRQLHNEDIMRSLEDARRDMDNVVAQTQASLSIENDVIEREYQSEPDLPYHSHYEENAALENLADAAVGAEDDNSNLLAELLDSSLEKNQQAEKTLQAETKVQLDKKTTPVTASASAAIAAPQVAQTSLPTTQAHDTSSDISSNSKAAL